MDEPKYAPRGYREIMSEFPRLLVLRSRIQEHLHMEPVAAILPASFNEDGEYDGSQIMGLPVIWGDDYGLVLRA